MKLDREHMEHIAMLLSYHKDISDDYGRAMYSRIRALEEGLHSIVIARYTQSTDVLLETIARVAKELEVGDG